MTKREKLLKKYTFESYLEKARKMEREVGLMSRSHVIKLQVLFSEKYKVCAQCESTEDITADHIFPVVFLKMLGYPADRMWRDEWYQPLCRSCNKSKGIKVDWEHPNTKLILETAMREKPTQEYAILQKETAKYIKMMEWREEKVLRLNAKR